MPIDSVRRVRRILDAFAAQPEEPLSLDVQWVEDPDDEPSNRPFELRRTGAQPTVANRLPGAFRRAASG
jgi:hypothetical protein